MATNDIIFATADMLDLSAIVRSGIARKVIE